MEEFIKEKTKMLDDKYCNLFTTYKGLRQDIVQLIKDSNQLEPLVMQKIADVDDYLLTVTTFTIVSKEKLKEEISNIIDKKFLFIEKNIKKANDAIQIIKSNFTV